MRATFLALALVVPAAFAAGSPADPAGPRLLLASRAPDLAGDTGIGAARGASAELNGVLFFTWCGTEGCELWRTDGTPLGTQLVVDIEAGSGSSSPAELTVAGGTLYFSAFDSQRGRELWRTDGTAPGTTRVRDIASGATSSAPAGLVAAAGLLYFAATEPSTGRELWKSDGTLAGTVRVADVQAGSASSAPEELTLVAGSLYFSADDGTHGRELWRSDGTQAGTRLALDISTGAAGSEPRGLAALGSTLLFGASDGVSGRELWSSDAAGTRMVKDAWAGNGSSDPSRPVVAGGAAYFAAADAAAGRELWRSDGSDAGTFRVKDIRPGPAGSLPQSLTVLGSWVCFSAEDGSQGREIWRSDGTEAGTGLVADLRPGSASSAPERLLVVAGRIVLRASGQQLERALFSSDATAAGTQAVAGGDAATLGEVDELIASSSGLLVSAYSPSSEAYRLLFYDNALLQGGQPAAARPVIHAFSVSPSVVSLGASTLLSWSVSPGSQVAVNGIPMPSPAGTHLVTPGATTAFTLTATTESGSASATATVHVTTGQGGLPAPVIASPVAGQTIGVPAITITWSAVTGATGYALEVYRAETGEVAFSGLLTGATATSTVVALPEGAFTAAVRACAGGYTAGNCGAQGTVAFRVAPIAPATAPTVTSPSQGSQLRSSTLSLSWTSVAPNPALPDMNYEVTLTDVVTSETALRISVPHPSTSTVFSVRASTYQLKVRACQAACGPFSAPVAFSVALPPVPTEAPVVAAVSLSSGNAIDAAWGAVAGADLYQVQVVQPSGGPGGGALTVAARQVSATSASLPAPAGPASVVVAACTGGGCGPWSAPVAVAVPGPNPAAPVVGTPMAGTVVAGPAVTFTWTRVPGDDGSNTVYRLFVQDLSRQAPALDVYTRENFHGAYLRAEGARFDALVIAQPGTAQAIQGPASGFNVSGSSALAPTLVGPAHQGLAPAAATVAQGNVLLSWSPVPGATLYEYFVAVRGQGSPVVTGVTSGTFVQVPLLASAGQAVEYSGIVRACPAGASCAPGSDAGWSAWSNAAGPGVTNFTVVP